MLLTTIAGSLPKPSWLAKPGVLWAPWTLSGPALAEGKRDAVLVALREQETAGIDIVTDGEQSRQPEGRVSPTNRSDGGPEPCTFPIVT